MGLSLGPLWGTGATGNVESLQSNCGHYNEDVNYLQMMALDEH